MDETTKTKKIWTDFHYNILSGKGIDIGCGPDPVKKDVKPFDMEDGDANVITQYVKDTFDFVYSSHCLEHMFEPRKALAEWWQLVKPGGHLFFLVPDEDLYEQGIFPSRFNPDHKATFTISKEKSWSPVSHNVLDLANELPGSEIVEIKQHDYKYDRRKLIHGPIMKHSFFGLIPFKIFYYMFKPIIPSFAKWIERKAWKLYVKDQTRNNETLAQIQCIVKKK